MKTRDGYILSFGWQCVVLVYEPNFPIFKHTGKIKNMIQTKYFRYISFIIILIGQVLTNVDIHELK